MIKDYVKNLVSKTELPYATSKFLPSNVFYEKNTIEIDDSFEIFVRKSVVKVPTFLTIKSFVSWNLYADEFEDIMVEEQQYKFLYDEVNGILYLMQRLTSNNGEDSKLDEVSVNGNSYVAITDLLEVPSKSSLLRIYNRIISDEADEYLFIETNRSMQQKIWAGVVIQSSFIR
jgi:hypothetical protein